MQHEKSAVELIYSLEPFYAGEYDHNYDGIDMAMNTNANVNAAAMGNASARDLDGDSADGGSTIIKAAMKGKLLGECEGDVLK